MNKKFNNEAVLKKHVGLIHCENRLSLLQRKICNILLFNALDKINQQESYEIGLKQLCSLIGYSSNDIALIKKSLKHLISTVLEWNLLDKEKINQETGESGFSVNTKPITWHASSLLSGVTIEEGIVTYSYSPQIRTILSSLDIYGRINLFIQAKFKSNYSLVLYENCIRFKNIEQTCWFTLDLFRALMGVEKNKYQTFKELNRNVIIPAVSEINEKADISIKPQFKKLGRKIIAIKYFISENENYFPKFKKKDKSKPNTEETSKLEDCLRKQFFYSPDEIAKLLASYEQNYIRSKINHILSSETYKTNKIKNLKAYTHAFLSNDYKTNAMSKDQALRSQANNEDTILDIKESNKRGILQKRYTQYKLRLFFKNLDSLNPSVKATLLEGYQDYLSNTSKDLLKMYRTNGLNSTLLSTNLLVFIERFHSDYLPCFLTYEDFLTEEECEV